MNLRDFEDALDRYGGDLQAWPAATRAEGEALIAASEAARQACDDLRSAEAVLRRTRPRMTDGFSPLLAQVTARAQVRPGARVAWRAGLACAFATVLVTGFVLGGALSMPRESPERTLKAAFSTTETLDVD